MGAAVGNAIFLLGMIALLSVALRPNSQIGTALNSTSKLVSNSIKAAKG
jgi:hypothetical protein